MMKLADCFAILELSKNATEKEVKAAYRRLAKVYHPDVADSENTASDAFLDLRYAYETIMKYLSFKDNYGEAFGEIVVDFRDRKDSAEEKKRQEYIKRVQRIRQIREERKQAEQNTVEKAFDEYITTWRYPFSKFVAVVATLISILLIADLSVEHRLEIKPIKDIEIENYGDYREYYFLIGDDWHYVEAAFFYNAIPHKYLQVESDYYFGTVVSLAYNRGEETVMQYIHSFFYDAIPVLIILLLLPLLSFFIKKPVFSFVFFFVNFNIYIAPLLILLVLFGGGRVFFLINTLAALY